MTTNNYNEADAINLLDRNTDDILSKFNEFKKNLTFISDTNDKFNLKTGDKILFLNGYDIPMITKILGFSAEGTAYLLWDCYWFDINLETRLIRKL